MRRSMSSSSYRGAAPLTQYTWHRARFTAGAEIQAAQRVGHTHGFLDTLGLDGHTDLHLHGPAADLLDADDLRPGAYPRAAAHRARKAHAVTAVVEIELHALGSQQLRQEVVSERQGEEPMGDGAAEWTLGGTLRVHVNPLMIAGSVGKRIDACLIDDQPLGRTVAATDGGLKLPHRTDYGCHDLVPAPGASGAPTGHRHICTLARHVRASR